MTTFRSFMKASWNNFAHKVASSAFSAGARTTATGCSATLHRGGFTSSGGGSFTSTGGAAAPPQVGQIHLLGLSGRGGSTFLGSAGGGGGTSSIPRFLDDSLSDAMRALEEEEALGFTSW
jgi:hypothetical protein